MWFITQFSTLKEGGCFRRPLHVDNFTPSDANDKCLKDLLSDVVDVLYDAIIRMRVSDCMSNYIYKQWQQLSRSRGGIRGDSR